MRPQGVKIAALLLTFSAFVFAQDAEVKARVRGVRDLAKLGDPAKVAPYLTDADVSVRLEATKALVDIGGPKTVEPLVAATRDNDPEIQIRATDGLVNVYLPGYTKSGIAGTLQRAGNAVKARFTDTNDQVIDGFVQVPAPVTDALSRLLSGGAGLEVRANAARALGILRAKPATNALVDALRSKDNQIMYESLIALQKINDPSVGPRVAFLLRDLEERVQIAALETVGLLRAHDAAAGVRDALDHARNVKVRRAASSSLAMLGEATDKGVFLAMLQDKDDDIRTAGNEGLGRMKDPSTKTQLDAALAAEKKTGPRLAGAFAVSSLGNYDIAELAPFRYLIHSLNLKSYRNVANAYLTELLRDPTARQAVYPLLAGPTLNGASKDERIQLASILGKSGGKDSESYLDQLSRDSDPDVAQEGIRSLRLLRTRL